MPPKVRFTSETIIEAAFNLARRYGWKGLSARAIAKELNSSTRPIYSYLKSMENIEEEVVKKAFDLFFEYMTAFRTGDPWLDQGLGYLLFARDEKHLFRCINDEKYSVLARKYGKKVWDALGKVMSDYPLFRELSEDQVDKIRVTRWFFIHGVASLINNRRYQIDGEKDIITFKDEKNVSLTDFVQKTSQVLYEGLK